MYPSAGALVVVVVGTVLFFARAAEGWTSYMKQTFEKCIYNGCLGFSVSESTWMHALTMGVFVVVPPSLPSATNSSLNF